MIDRICGALLMVVEVVGGYALAVQRAYGRRRYAREIAAANRVIASAPPRAVRIAGMLDALVKSSTTLQMRAAAGERGLDVPLRWQLDKISVLRAELDALAAVGSRSD